MLEQVNRGVASPGAEALEMRTQQCLQPPDFGFEIYDFPPGAEPQR